MRCSLYLAALAAAVTAGAPVGRSHAGPVSFQTIAATGQQIENAPAGTVIGRFNHLDAPSIGPTGGVSFSAGYGPGAIPVSVFEGRPGTARVVARSGTRAAGYPVGRTYGPLIVPMQDAQGRTAFFGSVSGPGATEAIWHGTPSGVSLLAGPPPAPGPEDGITWTFDRPLSWSMNPSGDLTVAQGRSRLYRISGGTVTPLLRPGDVVPGHPGRTFTQIASENVTNGGGVAALVAEVDRDAAIVIAAPGQLGLVALEGTQAAGLAPGMVYDGFQRPSINNTGMVAFWGTAVPSGDSGPVTEAIWYGSPGQVGLLARQGDQAPGAAPGVTFGYLSSTPAFWYPVINGRGEIAFGA